MVDFMKNHQINLLKWLYSQHLKIINGVRFTHREIDVVSCILSGKLTKTIAIFLSISPKTVEAHTYNILSKLGVSSRGDLINFIEASGKFSLIKKYYITLITQNSFKEGLNQLRLSLNKSYSCLICCLYPLKKDF